MSVRDNIESFAVQMEKQLDMYIEGENLVTFRENFKKFPNICFPEPFLNLSNDEFVFSSLYNKVLLIY